MPLNLLRLCRRFALRAFVLGAVAMTGLSAAHADLVQLEFRGTVVEEEFRVGTSSPLSLGTLVEGVFTFNDNTVGAAYGTHQARYFNAVTSHQLSIEGVMFSANTPGNIIIDDNPGGAFDRFIVTNSSFTGTGLINDMSVTGATMTLKDSTGTVFNSTALPSSVNLEDFDSRSLVVTFSNAAGTAVTAYRVEVTSVPEPATFALLLLVSPVAVWLIVRKRNQQPAAASA